MVLLPASMEFILAAMMGYSFCPLAPAGRLHKPPAALESP